MSYNLCENILINNYCTVLLIKKQYIFIIENLENSELYKGENINFKFHCPKIITLNTMGYFFPVQWGISFSICVYVHI